VYLSAAINRIAVAQPRHICTTVQVPAFFQYENPEVRQALDEAFRQPRYFLATTGQVSIDVLMNYLEDQ
jgi:hypothetical protein